MANFDNAIEVILAHEGGYVNDPLDPGGETKYGISKRSFPHIDIGALTVAEAKAIYRKEFWRFDGVESQEIATKLLDMTVNMGVSTGIRILQRILCVGVDGQFGPKTLAATNNIHAATLLNELRIASAVHYATVISRRPSMVKYVKGWMKRAIR